MARRVSDWIEAKEREEIAARKRVDEKHRDPQLEAAVIAYCNFRRDGGFMKWEQFQREYLARREKAT